MVAIDVREKEIQASLDRTLLTTSAEKIFAKIDTIPFDRNSIAQERLDLTNKSRTSFFPWRGQFSPELIEVLIKHYSTDTDVILDPFAGMGTTLFEAASQKRYCYGAEINPSAVEMAKTAHFINTSKDERTQAVSQAMHIAQTVVGPYIWDLFSYQEQHPDEEFKQAEAKLFCTMLTLSETKSLAHNILINAIMRYMSNKSSYTASHFLAHLREHCQFILGLPYSDNLCQLFHADARTIPLLQNSVDLIITSPPYINVFNYHQNNRPAMELAGWNLLEIAKSEIGANRKHRQNRFLTVVQYCLDMLDALREMKRVLRSDGKAIIVIGRESTVRGLRFFNGRMVAAIAIGGAGFRLEARQERKFKNKFGEMIYEDILHLAPDTTTMSTNDDMAYAVAVSSLLEAAKEAADEQIRQEVMQAVMSVTSIQRSPVFKQTK